MRGRQRAELAELGDGRGPVGPARGIFSPEIAAILMQIELRVDPSRPIFIWRSTGGRVATAAESHWTVRGSGSCQLTFSFNRLVSANLKNVPSVALD